MARYNPDHETGAIFAVVGRWLDQCLVHDYALIGREANIWSFERISAVRRRFRENPYPGPESFLTKLRRQLEELDDGAVQLAAEMLYGMLLFPSNITPPKKRQNVSEILEWRRRKVPLNEELLQDNYLTGIGSTGQGYNQKRPEEFGCFLDILVELKQLGPEERRDVLSEPWAFSKFLTRVNATNRQLPHILQHLLFPDTFERISSGADKRKLILAFTSEDPKKVKAMDREDRDRRLLALRKGRRTGERC